jgi:hypothetical protein
VTVLQLYSNIAWNQKFDHLCCLSISDLRLFDDANDANDSTI